MGIHKSPIQNTPELNIIAAWKKKAQDYVTKRTRKKTHKKQCRNINDLVETMKIKFK